MTQKDVQNLLFTKGEEKAGYGTVPAGRAPFRKMPISSLHLLTSSILLSTYYVPGFLPGTLHIAVNNTDQVPDVSRKTCVQTPQHHPPARQSAPPTSAAQPGHAPSHQPASQPACPKTSSSGPQMCHPHAVSQPCPGPMPLPGPHSSPLLASDPSDLRANSIFQDVLDYTPGPCLGVVTTT